jgi:hypothetical protein
MCLFLFPALGRKGLKIRFLPLDIATLRSQRICEYRFGAAKIGVFAVGDKVLLILIYFFDNQYVAWEMVAIASSVGVAIPGAHGVALVPACILDQELAVEDLLLIKKEALLFFKKPGSR